MKPVFQSSQTFRMTTAQARQVGKLIGDNWDRPIEIQREMHAPLGKARIALVVNEGATITIIDPDGTTHPK